MFGLGILGGFDFLPHFISRVTWNPEYPPGSLPFSLPFLSPFSPSGLLLIFNLSTFSSFCLSFPFFCYPLILTPDFSLHPLLFPCQPLTLLPSLLLSSVLSLPLSTFPPLFFPFSLIFYLPFSPFNFPKPPFLVPSKQMQHCSPKTPSVCTPCCLLLSSSNISIPWCTAGPNIVRSCCVLLACTPLPTLLVQQSWELLCWFAYSFRHLNPQK